MNGLLGMLVLMMPLPLILIWAILTWVFWRVGKRFLRSRFSNGPLRIALVVAFAVIWFGWSFWEAGGKKLYWDAKVRELCAVDGGVTVYETVELPAELYDYYADRNWILPDRKDADDSTEYFTGYAVIKYRDADPQVARTVSRVIRRSDGKVLGEYVRYERGGGDIPGPWHGSSYLCPDPTQSTGFKSKIFIKEDKV